MESRNQNINEYRALPLKVTICATWKSHLMEKELKGSNHINFEFMGCQGDEQM